MTFRNLPLMSLAMAGVLFTGAAAAQATPPASSASAPTTASATYQTPQGTVVMNSVSAAAPTIAPAPDFKTLSGGKKWITEEQATTYPPLANDFIHADSNKDGKISQSEYMHWTKQL
ncbi:MAG TPA: hypothetical protein VN043_05740 [Rhodanobacter sp.]|nr:hypothetical protein [Rhodanobacter sp.]